MYNCSQLVGVSANDLLEGIRKVTFTLMYYEMLITAAPSDMERKMLIQMHTEDTYIQSALIKVYFVLTGCTPLFPHILKMAEGGYLDGIEAVLSEDLQTAKLLTTLYLSAEVKYLDGLFINFFSLKCVQAANLNYILLINKLNHGELER